MVGAAPAAVVHKVPAEGALSATLFSGARYAYGSPSDPRWAPLLARWLRGLPALRAALGGSGGGGGGGPDLPLLWTADFIADDAGADDDGGDEPAGGAGDASSDGGSGDGGAGTAWRLGELNASCVGFSTRPELAGALADAAIAAATAARLGPAVAAAAAAAAAEAAEQAAEQQAAMGDGAAPALGAALVQAATA